VGVELLHRSGRAVRPTAVGRRLYQLARELLEAHGAMEAELEDLLGIRAGELTVGASTIPGEFILPTHLAAFRATYPEVRVTALIGDSDGIASLVAAGELELGVVGSGCDLQDLEVTRLWRDELVLAVPANHHWDGRRQVTVTELAAEPFILRERGSGTRRTVERALAGQLPAGTETLDVVAELGSTAAVKEGVLQGLGVSILSSRALERELAAGVVATLRIDGVDLARSFDIVRHRRRSLSPVSARFIDFLGATVGS